MSDETTQLSSQRTQRPSRGETKTQVGLALVASRQEPNRIGEVLLPPAHGHRAIWGRSAELSELAFSRVRPGHRELTGPPTSSGISRTQLSLSGTQSGALSLENVGRRPLLVNGVATAHAVVRAGSIVEVEGEMLFVASEYPALWETPRWATLSHPFGLADEDGIVGESPASWTLRDNLAFVSATHGHTLFLGESGSGKDVAAAAVARRQRGPYVARSAATFPEGLVDAELFGSAKNYPGSGMAARSGLVGEADGGTLFLDEIAELPLALQTRLLRVLDSGGEYHSLGDARVRRSSFRLIAATNQGAGALRDDLNARFEHRINVPPLSARGADVILIARELVSRLAQEQPSIFGRYIDGDGQPALSFGLVRQLLTDPASGGVRGVRQRLLSSARTSGQDVLLPAEVTAAPASAPSTPRTASTDAGGSASRSATTTRAREPGSGGSLGGSANEPAQAAHETTPEPDVVQACLDKHQGVQGPVWRELGFRNRYQLQRFIKKHGLRTATPDEP